MLTQKHGCGGTGCYRRSFLFGGDKMQSDNKITLSGAEKQLIEIVRSLEYGELRVMIKDKRPIRVEEIRKSIQLTADK